MLAAARLRLWPAVLARGATLRTPGGGGWPSLPSSVPQAVACRRGRYTLQAAQPSDGSALARCLAERRSRTGRGRAGRRVLLWTAADRWGANPGTPEVELKGRGCSDGQVL